MIRQATDARFSPPTYAVGGELARLGQPHETRIYGTIGNRVMVAHPTRSAAESDVL